MCNRIPSVPLFLYSSSSLIVLWIFAHTLCPVFYNHLPAQFREQFVPLMPRLSNFLIFPHYFMNIRAYFMPCFLYSSSRPVFWTLRPFHAAFFLSSFIFPHSFVSTFSLSCHVFISSSSPSTVLRALCPFYAVLFCIPYLSPLLYKHTFVCS
jgi:hypothetical protein